MSEQVTPEVTAIIDRLAHIRDAMIDAGRQLKHEEAWKVARAFIIITSTNTRRAVLKSTIIERICPRFADLIKDTQDINIAYHTKEADLLQKFADGENVAQEELDQLNDLKQESHARFALTTKIEIAAETEADENFTANHIPLEPVDTEVTSRLQLELMDQVLTKMGMEPASFTPPETQNTKRLLDAGCEFEFDLRHPIKSIHQAVVATFDAIQHLGISVCADCDRELSLSRSRGPERQVTFMKRLDQLGLLAFARGIFPQINFGGYLVDTWEGEHDSDHDTERMLQYLDKFLLIDIAFKLTSFFGEREDVGFPVQLPKNGIKSLTDDNTDMLHNLPIRIRSGGNIVEYRTVQPRWFGIAIFEQGIHYLYHINEALAAYIRENEQKIPDHEKSSQAQLWITFETTMIDLLNEYLGNYIEQHLRTIRSFAQVLYKPKIINDELEQAEALFVQHAKQDPYFLQLNPDAGELSEVDFYNRAFEFYSAPDRYPNLAGVIADQGVRYDLQGRPHDTQLRTQATTLIIRITKGIEVLHAQAA